LWKALLLEATGATAATTEHQRNHSHIFSRAFQRELNGTTTIQRAKNKNNNNNKSPRN
jgi:hypothetical protein